MLKEIPNKAIFQVSKHSPVILTVSAVVGVAGVAYLSAKAAIKSDREIRAAGLSDVNAPREKIELVWRNYIPAGLVGVATVGAIVCSTRVGLRRAAAAQTALVVAERTYAEYRAKVVDELGKHKEQTIRDEIVKERVGSSDIPSQAVLMTGPGNVLTMELFTGRFFACDMETLRKAVNQINSRLLAHDHASLSDFYDLLGLDNTSVSYDLGWKTPRLMELEYTAVLAQDGRPCVAFEYNYVVPLFGKTHE